MISFFYFEKPVTITQPETGFNYEHRLEGNDSSLGNTSLDRIYFSTPSHFARLVKSIQQQIGPDAGGVFALKSEMVRMHSRFPKDIGFNELDGVLKQFPPKPKFKVAIINAMSYALGDHLIGMRAFDIFYSKLTELLPGIELEINFFQMNPFYLLGITKQWKGKVKEIYFLPRELSLLFEHDAYIDLGTMLIRENFDTQPMIDFFLQALSINPRHIPDDEKGLSLQPEVVVPDMPHPSLLFHFQSTDPVRSMGPEIAERVARQLLERTDYSLVTVKPLNIQHDRYLNLTELSTDFDHFAGIVGSVDAIVTVDTCVYHLADAFGVPTVALFTSIEPDKRTRYYPKVEAIMLESPEGRLYGKHRASPDPEEQRLDLEYVDQLWAKLDVQTVLEKLQKVTQLTT